jgi:hypothetical protein
VQGAWRAHAPLPFSLRGIVPAGFLEGADHRYRDLRIENTSLDIGVLPVSVAVAEALGMLPCSHCSNQVALQTALLTQDFEAKPLAFYSVVCQDLWFHRAVVPSSHLDISRAFVK